MTSNLEHSNLRASVAWNNGNPTGRKSLMTHALAILIRFASDPALIQLLQNFAQADLKLYTEKNMYFKEPLE
ncbi:hypothetical protein H0H92_001346, partial [Tricholoma furcatifolium]